MSTSEEKPRKKAPTGGDEQPRSRDRAPKKVQVPVGLEQLLYLAAQNENFRTRLVQDRESALQASGVNLRTSELAALDATSNDALEAMIASISPQNPQRRKFMGMVAASVASLAAGTISSCDVSQHDEARNDRARR